MFIDLKSHLKNRGDLITKLEYQRKPKRKENSIETRIAQLVRHPLELSNTLAYKHGIYELPHELPSDLRLGILGN